jgi:hypothetical protein
MVGGSDRGEMSAVGWLEERRGEEEMDEVGDTDIGEEKPESCRTLLASLAVRGLTIVVAKRSSSSGPPT